MENPVSPSCRPPLLSSSSHTAAQAVRQRGPRPSATTEATRDPALGTCRLTYQQVRLLATTDARTEAAPSPPPSNRGHGGGPPIPLRPPRSHLLGDHPGPPRSHPGHSGAPTSPCHHPSHQGRGGGSQPPAITEDTVLAHLPKPAPPRSKRRCIQRRNQGPSTVTGNPRKAPGERQSVRASTHRGIQHRYWDPDTGSRRRDRVYALAHTQGSNAVAGIPIQSTAGATECTHKHAPRDPAP